MVAVVCMAVLLQELAHQFGLYPEVAASRAAYWRALAPPVSAIVQSAQHACTTLQQRKVRYAYLLAPQPLPETAQRY
jgi:hypothetical protein